MAQVLKKGKQLLNIGNLTYKTLIAILAAIVFVVYGPKMSSELPDAMRIFFENSIARFSIIVLIIYLGNKNLEVSLFLSLILMLMMNFVHKYDIKESLSNKIHSDFYLNKGSIESFTGKHQKEEEASQSNDFLNSLIGEETDRQFAEDLLSEEEKQKIEEEFKSKKLGHAPVGENSLILHNKSDKHNSEDVSSEVEFPQSELHHSESSSSEISDEIQFAENTGTHRQNNININTEEESLNLLSHSDSNVQESKLHSEEGFSNYVPSTNLDRKVYLNNLENDIQRSIHKYKGF